MVHGLGERTLSLDFAADLGALSLNLEMGAYETLWQTDKATLPKLVSRTSQTAVQLASALVDAKEALANAERVSKYHGDRGIRDFGISVYQSFDYPARLRDANIQLTSCNTWVTGAWCSSLVSRWLEREHRQRRD